MSCSAVILAGGQSRRMGRDKAWLSVGGQPLLARQLELVRAAGAAEVFISGRVGTDYSGLGCPVVADRFPDTGPLAGIEAALQAAAHARLLVLAVDLPRMSVDCLRQLLAASTDTLGVVPCLHGLPEPLAAVYPRAARALAEAQIRNQQYAVRAFAERCVAAGLVQWQSQSANNAACFDNWNTPHDLEPLTSAAAPA